MEGFTNERVKLIQSISFKDQTEFFALCNPPITALGLKC